MDNAIAPKTSDFEFHEPTLSDDDLEGTLCGEHQAIVTPLSCITHKKH